MYQHGELSRDELLSYIDLFENIDKKKYLISICEVYLRKHEQYSREKTTRVLWILAEAYESVDLGKSLKLYTRLSKRETDRDLLYRAEKARADTYLYELKDYGSGSRRKRYFQIPSQNKKVCKKSYSGRQKVP